MPPFLFSFSRYLFKQTNTTWLWHLYGHIAEILKDITKYNKRNKNCTKLWEPWLKTLMPSLPILLFCTQTLLTQLSKGYAVQAVCYPALTTLIFPCLMKYPFERWFFNDGIVFHLKNLCFTIKIKQHVLIDSELGMKYSGLNFPFIYPDFEALGKESQEMRWENRNQER